MIPVPVSRVDPLYRPRAGLPPDVPVHRFGTLDAAVTVTDTDPSSIEASYLPDRGVSLIVTDDVTPVALAGALPAFRTYAETLADRPTRATVTLPSRALDLGRVARAAGFAPSGVVAVASPPVASPPAVSAVVVREARASDASVVAELTCEQTDYEARVGTLRSTDAIRAAIRAAAAATVEHNTVLVAEVDGAVVGTVVAQEPAASVWISGRLAVEPAAYLSTGATTAAARGRGVGRALVAALHERHRADGVVASLLHYGPYNPLSVPFWSQCGYRPLLITHAAVLT